MPVPHRLVLRARSLAALTVGLAVVAGCGATGSRRVEGGRPSVSSTAPPPTAPPTTACSDASVIAGWPLARRAALTVAAPVMNFDASTVQAAAAAGAGGVLFLGSGVAPASLGAELTAATSGATAGAVALRMADEEGGGIQRLAGVAPSLPWARDMARTMTPGQVQALATRVGTAMAAAGVNTDLAPVADLDAGEGPDADDPDGARSWSLSATTTSTYASAFARGLAAAGVVAVAKHFPGLGQATGNTDDRPADTRPLAQLDAAGLLPFQSLVAGGVPAVMVANAAVPGLTTTPASLSSSVITGLLRQRLGFGGLVLTDSLSAGAITATGLTLEQAAVESIAAGADMILFGGADQQAADQQAAAGSAASAVGATVTSIAAALVAAVGSGALPESRLDAADVHILTAAGVQLCGR